ncbi:hypothetical protein [Vibrio quintilis]|uniref:Transmembrane protein n=1 Tax=Vibrio quintilis TaxID=1117707 RepID=A0A1M7Z3D0_9VIBR|nr:hypothetical protein [Vibrio quintilis]SHO59332.1 hypothetical protein VQ7734_05116 [Vibrio quintilis]
MTTDNSYQPTAYNSRTFTPQPQAQPRGIAQKLMKLNCRVLPFTRPTETISTQLDSDIGPEKWKEVCESSPDKKNYWNEQTLSNSKFSTGINMLLIASSFGKGIVVMFVPLCAIIELVLYFIKPFDIHSWNDFYHVFILTFFIMKYAFPPSILFWGMAELINKGYWNPRFMHACKIFSMNRRTGMVTLYHGRDKVRYSHPFIEFDCLLASNPGPQGQMLYSLYLVHRYHGYQHAVPLNGLIGSKQMVAEYYRVWNMIQRFMDVSQPLPDTLVLEESRPLDPVTAAYDQQTGRDPEYWRKMTEEAFRRTIHSIRSQQNSTPEKEKVLNIFESA